MKSSDNLSNELMRLSRIPLQEGFIIPGIIDNYNEAVVIGAVAQGGRFVEQCNLSRFLGISRPAITQITSEMIKKGLIEQTVNPDDRRGFILSLTDEGKKIALWMTARKQLINKIQFRGLTDREIKLYNTINTKMAENLLDITERELTRLPDYNPDDWDASQPVTSYLSHQDQELFVSMAKRVRKVNRMHESLVDE